jgi:hypothetical protein
VNPEFRQRAALIVIGLTMLAGGFAESFDGKQVILAIAAVSLGLLHAFP